MYLTVQIYLMFHLINFIDFSKYSISKYAYSEFDAVNTIQTSWDF